jgi:hypothetical protein
MSFNNDNDYVNNVMDLHFKDYNLNEENKILLSNEISVFNHVIMLYNDDKFENDDKLNDFDHMFEYLFKAFLTSDNKDYDNTLYLIDYLNENEEELFAIWLFTNGPLSESDDINNEKSYLFRWIVSDHELVKKLDVNMINSLLEITEKFSFDDFYRKHYFEMYIDDSLFYKDKELTESILDDVLNSLEYILNTIYSDDFIQNKVVNLTQKQIDYIEKQKNILLNKKQMFLNKKQMFLNVLDGGSTDVESLSGDTEFYYGSDIESLSNYDDDDDIDIDDDNDDDNDDFATVPNVFVDDSGDDSDNDYNDEDMNDDIEISLSRKRKFEE